MPRPRFSDWILTPQSINIAPSGHYDLLVDQVDTFFPQLFYKVTWSATDSPTGISVDIYRGYPDTAASTGSDYTSPETNIGYIDVPDSIQVDSQPAPSTITPQTTRNDLGLNPQAYPRRVKIRFTNNDATNACTLFVSGDR